MLVFNPTFLIFLLLITSFLIKKFRNKLLLITILAFYFFTNGFIINRLLSVWESPGISIDEIENYHCGILLSGTFKYDKSLNRLIANHDVDRVWQTIQLYKKKKISKIILIGFPDKLNFSHKKEFDSLKEILVSLNIPKDHIIEEGLSKNTFENAKECKKLLLKNNIYKKKHLLITSSIHMKRAMFCFKNQDIHIDSFSTDQVNAASEGFRLIWLIPNTENLILWNKLIKEFIGYFYYFICFNLKF